MPVANDQVISPKMKSQLQWTPISIPAIFPILNELFILVHYPLITPIGFMRATALSP